MNDLYQNAMSDISSGFAFDDEVLYLALKRIYKAEFNIATELEENLFNEFWRKLNDATVRGLGNKTPIDPDFDFLQELKLNNGVFAAFKVHRMQNDMAAQLLDENGSLKPFEQWLNNVQSIADHQCRKWFQTEYDTAVKRAHIAGDWRQFEREADVLPNLEWIKSTSITPGADHQKFWGTTRPVNDNFWASHKPGDRWGCKCSLRATDKPATTPATSSGNKSDKPASGLDNNPAKDGQIFSDTHPYNPPNCAACTLPGKKSLFQAKQNGFFNAKDKKDCYHCSRPVQLLKNSGIEISEPIKYNSYKKYKNGGEVLIHPDVKKKGSDYKHLLTIASLFAKQGEKAILTPSVHYKSRNYTQIYGALNNTNYYRKCPDLKIGDDFYEFESFVPPFKKNKISHMLNKGLKQSNKIVINNSKGASERYIKRLIYERANRGVKIDEVWLYEKGKLKLLYKKQ